MTDVMDRDDEDVRDQEPIKPPSREDQRIVKQARERAKRCIDWERTARINYIEDTKFANGDARNNFQWEEAMRSYRTGQNKPAFTINKTRQHCLQVINDARQNKQGVTVKAAGGEASYKSAQIFAAVIRHIEYKSNAQQNVYTTALRTQVIGGIGYWRVVTDYADDESFDQEIFIRRIKDPLSVYLDPDISEADGSDAKFGFVFEQIPRDEAEEEYPQLKDRWPDETLSDHVGWFSETHVRVAEYFRVVFEDDELVAFNDDNGQQVIMPLSKVVESLPAMQGWPLEAQKAKLRQMGARFRTIRRRKVEWYKIAGDLIIDRRDWPGVYIPIVRLPGEETVIEGQMDRKGHTRSMLDPQRNLNYWTSEGAAQVALQTKSPWVGPKAAFEGNQAYWDKANTTPTAYLPYNHMDDDGNPIPPPQRIDPPVMASAFIQGIQIAGEQLREVSGQYQAEMGAPSNEKSGVAIQQRQRQADNATYHYVDHQAMAIRFTGKILIDLIPKVYDTERVVKMLAEDGTETDIKIDPNAKQALQEHKTSEPNDDQQSVLAIFNPNVGKYEVEADIGPGFATKRQEAFNALSQIIQSSPDLMSIAGDLMFKAADFPLADELAQRMRRMVPPQALGDGPSPGEEQLKQQNDMLQQLMGKLQQEIARLQMEAKSKADANTVNAYKAETDRLEALHDFLPTDMEGMMALVRIAVNEALANPIPEIRGNAPEEPQEAQEAPQDQGALAPPQEPENGLEMAPEGQIAPEAAPPMEMPQ